MSTLKVNTVQHNTTGFNNVVQFTDGAGTENGTLCRAWVNFNGTGTVAIRDSFNVSSITDNNTGDYTVNFSNSLDDANYMCNATPRSSNDSSVVPHCQISSLTSPTASLIRIRVNNIGISYVDSDFVSVSVFR